MTQETINLNAKLKIEPNSLSVDMDGEKVTMNMENDEFYGINGIGSMILDIIESGELTVAALVSQLTEQYSNDDPEQIEKDVLSFLSESKGYGILLVE